MTLRIQNDVFEQMLAVARRAAPIEACGMLAGTNRHATKCYVLTNADASPDHFSMAPSEQFAAVKDMRKEGLKMLAIWHSHPATPARMSNEDLLLAYTPDVVYIILSLATPDMPDIRGFILNDGLPNETEITIIDQKEQVP